MGSRARGPIDARYPAVEGEVGRLDPHPRGAADPDGGVVEHSQSEHPARRTAEYLHPR